MEIPPTILVSDENNDGKDVGIKLKEEFGEIKDITLPKPVKLTPEQLDDFSKEMNSRPMHPHANFSIVNSRMVRNEIRSLRKHPQRFFDEFHTFPWHSYYCFPPRWFFGQDFRTSFPTKLSIVDGIDILEVYTATRLVMYREFEKFADRIDKIPIFINKMGGKYLKEIFFKRRDAFSLHLYKIALQFGQTLEYSMGYEMIQKSDKNIFATKISNIFKDKQEEIDNLKTLDEKVKFFQEELEEKRELILPSETPMSIFLWKQYTIMLAERTLTDWCVANEFEVTKLKMIMENLKPALAYKENKKKAILDYRLPKYRVPTYEILGYVEKMFEHEVYSDSYRAIDTTVYREFTDRIRIIVDGEVIRHLLNKMKDAPPRRQDTDLPDPEKMKEPLTDEPYDEKKVFVKPDQPIVLDEQDNKEFNEQLDDEKKKMVESEIKNFQEYVDKEIEGAYKKAFFVSEEQLTTGQVGIDVETKPVFLLQSEKPSDFDVELGDLSKVREEQNKNDLEKMSGDENYVKVELTSSHSLTSSTEEEEGGNISLEDSTLSV